MPRMKSLKAFTVSETGKSVSPGEEFEISSDSTADSYERKGMAVRVVGVSTAAGKGKARANPAAAAGPLPSRGGKTGAGKPRSSSPAGRARAKRGSAK